MIAYQRMKECGNESEMRREILEERWMEKKEWGSKRSYMVREVMKYLFKVM